MSKKHKTAIIIGTVVVVAAAAVVTCVVISASAAAAGTTSAAAAASNKEKKGSVPPSSINTPTEIPSTSLVKQTPQVQSVVDEKIVSFKKQLAEEHFLLSDLKNQSAYSIEQNGRILGSTLAHQTLNEIGANVVPLTTEAHYEIDRAFSTDYTTHYLHAPSTDNFSDVYQFRGQYGHDILSYDQAITDLGRAIELNPNNREAYLERAAAYLDKGDIDRSLKDYRQYTARRAPPVKNAVDFTKGFAKGLPKGAVESTRQLISFASNCVAHPINTGREMWNTVFLLKELAHSQDWEVIAQALVPEVHQLITQWDVLSPQQQGELAGYAFGKYGMDFIAPGALTKTISKGAKGTKELAEICKSLKNAENTLTLEALATAGKPGVKARLSELRAADRSTIMSKELIALETGEEVLSEAAINQYKAFFRDAQEKLQSYGKKPFPEMEVRMRIHEVGIKTFPRPNGIPENYIVTITDSGCGMKYTHPNDTGTYIRVMPANPLCKFSCQKKPYVKQQKHGKTLDNLGNVVGKDSPESHIPLEEFINRIN